jgi:hypothetical protein
MAFVSGRSQTKEEERRVVRTNINLRLHEHWRKHPPG